MRPPTDNRASLVAAAVSGKRFSFAGAPRDIESTAFEFGNEIATLIVPASRGEQRIACGSGRWLKGRSSFVNGMEGRMVTPGEHAIATSGAWTADDTYSVKLCLDETPFYISLDFRFNGDELVLDSEYNVAFGPTRLPQLVGRAR